MALTRPSVQRQSGSLSRALSKTSMVGSASAAVASGWQRLQGLNPASIHLATESKNTQCSAFGLRAGQVSRQNTPVEVTPTYARPS